jgi:hypothetical protein
VIQFKSKKKELTVRLPLAAFTTPPDTGASTKTKSCPSPENHTHTHTEAVSMPLFTLTRCHKMSQHFVVVSGSKTHHWKTLNPTCITISSEEKKGSTFELAASRGWAPALPLLT